MSNEMKIKMLTVNYTISGLKYTLRRPIIGGIQSAAWIDGWFEGVTLMVTERKGTIISTTLEEAK